VVLIWPVFAFISHIFSSALRKTIQVPLFVKSLGIKEHDEGCNLSLFVLVEAVAVV
jgi:hypothetical protein